MPTVDIEPKGNMNMCKYNIFHDEDSKGENDNCKKQIEYTPIKVDPKKLARYVVPYIEMTHEDLENNKEEQLKVKYENCNRTHFESKNFTYDD